MPILTIPVMPPDRSSELDLRTILSVLNLHTARAVWEVDHADENFWAMGKDIRAIEALVGSGKRISGETLRSIADDIHQVIWGEFRAFDGAAKAPWVIVRAIDGSCFEIESEDETLIALVRQHFDLV